jgi:hypothetical protein
MKKICKICNKKKELSDYYSNHKTKDRLWTHCKNCHKKIAHEGYIRMKKEIGDEEWKNRARISMRRWRKNNIEKAREKSRFYYAKYREKYRENVKKSNWKITEDTILKYGGECTCCNESNIMFLSLDHINGGGNKHRKKEGISFLAGWAKKNNYPDILQVLCFNCNFGRETRGGENKICPHKIEVID